MEDDKASKEKTSDEQEMSNLQKSFKEDFQMFLLNNILMSIQFFENYERDIDELRSTCLEEKSLNPDQLKMFEADRLHKLVASRVTFRKKLQNSKEVTDVIHPLRIYVTYQNINLSYNSSCLHTPHQYKFIVQSCQDDKKETAGYINLIEYQSLDAKHETNCEGKFNNFSDNSAYNNEIGASSGKNSSNLCTASIKNEEFYIADPEERSKPHPLKLYKTNERVISPPSIPKFCFKEKEKQILHIRRLRVPRLEKNKLIQRMLLSAAFKKHFCEVFYIKLAEQMKFETFEVDRATFHYDTIHIQRNKKSHCITPAFKLNEWPMSATNFSRANDGGYRFEWPTKQMQKNILASGCYLIPVGYSETGTEKSDYSLEWKIEFPRAEQYLTMHMMQSQVRCYLFVLIICKTYLDFGSNSVHFGARHVANLLFLLVRKNAIAWPEYNQGDKLLRFLKILIGTIQKKDMKHFFLHKRNMYENSPLKVLHRAQTMFTRIVNNPIPYILKALQNLKYKENFYPILDCLKLYNILMMKDVGSYLRPRTQEESTSRKRKPEENISHSEIIQEYEFPSIDEERILQLNEIPQLLQVEVLRFFINHFINLGRQCQLYQGFEQSMLYLTHAKRLTIILSSLSRSPTESEEFRQRISNAITKYNKQMEQNNKSKENLIK